MRERCPECGILRFQRYQYCPKCGHHYETKLYPQRKVATYQKCMDCIHFHYVTLERFQEKHPGAEWSKKLTQEEFANTSWGRQGYCDITNGKSFQRTRRRCVKHYEEKTDDNR